jgi:hypothetical protein
MLALCHGVKVGSLRRSPSFQHGSTDGTCLDSPTAGGSFFPAPAVAPLSLDTSTPSRPRPRPHRLSQPDICPSARCHSRLSTLGVRTTASPTRPQVLRLADCDSGAVPILPFPPPFLAGTAGWRHLLRPGGAALLCFPATRDPPGFRSLPKRLAIICPGRTANLSSRFPQKKRSLAWGAGTTCFIVPREKAGGKRRKSLCIKTAFPSSASSATTHS